MVLLQLILAHLLGDFVFQSNDLIHRKYKSWTGVWEHVCIITFFTVLFLFPFWLQSTMWISAAVIFAVHFTQDLLKIKYDLTFNAKKKSTIPYFLDQLFHISLIAYIAQFFKGLESLRLPEWVEKLYFDPAVTAFLIGIILVTYTWDITIYQFTRQKDKRNKEYVPDFKKMQKRLLAYTIGFGVALLVSRGFM